MIEFRPSPIHGIGGFGKSDIPDGTRLLEYIGRKISKEESRRQCQQNNPFVFYFNDRWDLDGNLDGNAARFLNHSCAPNCEAELVGDVLSIVAKRAINKGEELTFNYGYDIENFREYPCHCGAPVCVGFILAEEFRHMVRTENSPPSKSEETK